MANRICCVCGTEENRHYKKVEGYSLVRCVKCGLVYLKASAFDQKGFLDDAKTGLGNKEKEKVEYWSFPALYMKYDKVFLRFFDERLKRIRKYNKSVKSMLDVGCGYGFWMDYAKKQGIDPEGIDLSSEAVAFATKTLNQRAYKEEAMCFNAENTYDLIMMFDILEHLEDPNAALAKYREMLSKGGLLYIQVPNIIGFRIPLTHGYGLPYHLWQYSYKTLSRLLKKNGYNVLGHWTGPMGVIGEYEKNKNIFLKEVMWKATGVIYLGNRLQVIASPAKRR